MQACKASIPWGNSRVKRGNVWWNAKLRRIRTETRKERTNIQRERDQERRAELREVFRRKRAAYKEAIKEAKIQSLRRTLSQGSPQDPWGFADRLIASKKRGEATPRTTIQDSEGNWAGNRTETAMALIRKYLPEDHPGSDTPENRETRASRVEWSEDQANKIRATDVSQLLYFLLLCGTIPTTMSTQVR
jgi:hypothetical protein